MADAFIDESWSPPSAGDDYFLAVVAVITTNRRRLELMVRRLSRKARLRAQSELKASASSTETIIKFLRALADDPSISIVVVVWRGQRKEVKDYEKLYQRLVGRCAVQVVRRNKRIDLFVDKRYTNQDQQRDLEGEIREALAVVPGNIVRIFQEESHVAKELAAPDFVAWTFMQRYSSAHDEFYKIIKPKVIHLDDLSPKRKSGSP